MCEEWTRSFSTLSCFIVRLMVCIAWKFPRPHVAARLAASLLHSASDATEVSYLGEHSENI